MIFCAYHFKWWVAIKTHRDFFESYTKKIFLVLMFYTFYCTIKDFLPFIYKNNMITDLFYLFHTMSTKKYCRSSLRKFENFVFDEIAVYGVEATERFIKNDQFRFM